MIVPWYPPRAKHHALPPPHAAPTSDDAAWVSAVLPGAGLTSVRPQRRGSPWKGWVWWRLSSAAVLELLEVVKTK